MSKSEVKKNSDQKLVETQGIEFIPDYNRDSRPVNVFFVFIGAQFCFAIMTLGALPVIFGLGWWASFWAITLGLILGCLVIAPISMIGPQTGTNGVVASRAFFGVRGAIIGGMITLFICIGFGALNIWTGAEAVLYGGQELFNWSVSNNLLAVTALILMLILSVITFFGYRLVIYIEKFGTWLIGLLLIIGVLVCLPQFNAGYHGGDYVLSSFWPTWLLAFFVAAGLPISYGSLANDYTRYIPKATSKVKSALGLGLGMFIGCFISMNIAAMFTTMFMDLTTPFVEGLFTVVPSYFVIPLLIIGVVGSIPQGSVAYYSASLTIASLGWKLNRIVTTVLASIIMITLVLIGIYKHNMITLVDSFIAIIIVALSPWLVITLIGLAKHKANFSTSELHSRSIGGQYWFTNGFNIVATTSWLMGFLAGLMFTSTLLFEGPLVKVINNIDISLFAAMFTGGVVYYTLDSLLQNKADKKVAKVKTS